MLLELDSLSAPDKMIGVEEGQIVTLIGANGALPERMAELGIAPVPEGRRVFPYLSVRENLEMGGNGESA